MSAGSLVGLRQQFTYRVIPLLLCPKHIRQNVLLQCFNPESQLFPPPVRSLSRLRLRSFRYLYSGLYHITWCICINGCISIGRSAAISFSSPLDIMVFYAWILSAYRYGTIPLHVTVAPIVWVAGSRNNSCTLYTINLKTTYGAFGSILNIVVGYSILVRTSFRGSFFNVHARYFCIFNYQCLLRFACRRRLFQ